MTWELMETASVSLRAGDSERTDNILRTAIVSATALLWGTTAMAQSLPTGGSVAAGSATISQPSSTQLDITQSSDTAIVNWDGFSVGSGSTVNIHQPRQQSAILNRVTGDTTSQIHGQLNANGQVFLVNPNGIFIGPNSHVNTGGFVASTLAISDDDFLNGRYRFEGSGNSASVENAGTISIVPGGYAALIGGKVSNSGLIRVPLGKVGLGAGEQVTLDVSGDGFLQVAVPSDSDDATMEALVTNSGRIEAEGGLVHLKAASARDAARQVINMSGVIEAKSVGGVSGAVVLGGSGGAVRISGTIDTSARETIVETSLRPRVRAQDGGTITITGEAIALAGATLSADGAGGGDGGTILVGGDYQGGGTLQTAQTTSVDASSTLTADGGEEGNGGRIIVWSDYSTIFSGFNSARGGEQAGDGGFVEVSGKIELSYRGLTDTRAPSGSHGTLLLDPSNIFINSSGALGTVDPATIVANLDLGDVIITTAGTGELIPGSGPPVDLGGPDGQAGDITVEEAVVWASSSNLTLRADNDIDINAAITAPDGGLTIDAVGDVETGSGGAIDVASFTLESGSWDQNGGALPSFAAGDFSITDGATFLRVLGGSGTAASPYQLTDVYGLQGIDSSGLDGDSFELVNNIDASVTSGWSGGFDPIDTFSGSLDGNRFAIDGLNIDQGDGLAAFFLAIEEAGSVSNLSITNADIDGGIASGVALSNSGLISGVSFGGTVTAQNFSGASQASGLVGFNEGTIEDSFSTARVEAIFPPDASDAAIIGAGLVIDNVGTIERSNSSGPVILTSLTGSGDALGAGLAAFNSGTIRDSYSTSDITANNVDDTVTIGGLVIDNDENLDFGTVGTIERTFATGAITSNGSASTTFGGLVVFNDPSASVTASFWDSQSTGVSTSDGGTALTTSQLQDTESFYRRASSQGWDFTSVWAPGTGSTNPANYTTSPVLFAIPDDVAVPAGQTSSASTTGTVYGGPSLYRFGPASDTLNTSSVFSPLNFASTSPGATTFTLGRSSVTSSGGQVYTIAALPGAAVITNGTIITVPPTPTIEVTPTVDTTITGGGGGGTAVTTVAEAEAALGTIENVSQEFDEEIASCASSGESVSEYLACLAQAMDEYAADLDGIVKGLPPGLDSVGDIIRGASAGIRETGEEASRRLSLATTAEERNAIRREAVQQARRQIRQAQREIRKAITLIRASDPELAIIQNQQVETIVAAVGQAEIGLTRAIGL